MDCASLATALTCFVLLATTTRQGVRLYVERQRAVREYLSEAKITPPHIDILHLMQGGTRAEFLVAALVSAGVTLAAVGVGTLFHDPDQGWGLGLVAVGAVIA